jgi:hypothetical protein
MSTPHWDTIQYHIDSSTGCTSQSSTQRLKFSTLLGHPHDQASPQATEPFLHQFPTQDTKQCYYVSPRDLYSVTPLYISHSSTMDNSPVVIGYKSRYNNAGQKTPSDRPARKPREIVQVLLNNEEVGYIPLGVLVRFSRYAKETFPKSAAPADGAKTAEAPKSPKETKSADMSKAAASTEVDGLDLANKLKNDDVQPVPAQQSTTSAPVSSKHFEVFNDDAWDQPSFKSVEYILWWMGQNKHLRNNEPLLPITTAPLPDVTLPVLVDTYAAVLAYGLTPFPHDLRHEILNRLTTTPVNLNGFKSIAQLLPLHDPIVTRLLTSHFEHMDAQAYTGDVADAIYDYIVQYDGDSEDEPFFSRYKKIQRSREYKVRQTKRNCKHSELLEGLKAKFEDFAGPQGILADTKATGEKTARESTGEKAEKSGGPAAEKATPEVPGRCRNRRQQQSSAQEKNGQAKAAAARQ